MAIYARKNLVITDEAGNIVNGATVTVQREVGGFPLVQLYSDRNGANALGNPFVAADGADAGFHVAGGAYKITATKAGFTRTWRYEAVGRAAESDLAAVPDVTVDNTVPRFDGTGGAIQTSGVTIDDSDNITTNGSATAARFAPTGSTVPANGMYLPAANTLGLATNSTRQWIIDSSGRLTYGNLTNVNAFRNTIVQVNHGSGVVAFGANRWSADAFGGQFLVGKSRSATVGTATIVQNGDTLGSFDFVGSDGAQFWQGAQMAAIVSGSPALNSIPTRLTFSTNSGGTSVSPRMHIGAAGGVSVGTSTDPGSGNFSATGAIQPGSFTVATLPAGATGQTVYCSNLRVFNGAGTQEGAGAGTGGHVTYNGSAWKIAGTNITAVA